MDKLTKAADVQKRIADEIVHGRRPPGSTLDETTLAREYAVSRTPIREAIRQLEASGLIACRPHRSAVVCDILPARLDDMFAVMGELEALCACWAAQTMTADACRALREMHEGSAALVKRKDREGYVAFNDLFHGAIYDGARNAFLAETTRAVRLRLAPFRRVQFESKGRLSRSFQEHGAIVTAIEQRDPFAADDAMRRHIGVVRVAVDMATQDRAPATRQREAAHAAPAHD